MISLDQGAYEEFENSTMVITIVRSGDFAQPVTVYLTSVQVLRDNVAVGKLFPIKSIHIKLLT